MPPAAAEEEEEILEGTAHTDVTVHVPITSHMLNDLGLIRVGELLKMMDITACMSAERHCLTSAVTLSMDDVNFKDLRANAGDLLVLQSKVNRAFGTSMEVGLRVEVERPETPEQNRHLCSSYFVFVGLDAAGKKQTAPELIPQTDRERVRWALAQERRRIRMDHSKIVDRVVMTTAASRTTSKRYSVKSTAVEPGARDANEVTQMVLPQHANHHGNTFGGVIMQWATELCETVCTRHCKRRVVLVSVDDMFFLSPSKVGARIVLKASVNRVFHRTMEVGIRIEAHSLDGAVALINKAYFTMNLAEDVIPRALEDAGKAAAATKKKQQQKQEPVAALEEVEQVVLRTEQAKARFKAALGRRRVRLERLQLKSGSQLAWLFTPETNPRDFILENLRALERTAIPDEVLGQTPENGTSSSRGTWGQISSTDGVSVWTKTSMTEGVSIKSETVLRGVSFAAVVFAVSDCDSRLVWDQAVTSYKVCEDFGPSVDADVCHLSVDTRAFDAGAGKPTDFVLFRSWKAEGDTFVLASHSIVHDKVPVVSGVMRGQAASSGFIVRQLNFGTSAGEEAEVEIQYVMQLNTGATSIVASEMVGTSKLASLRMKSLANFAKSVTREQMEKSPCAPSKRSASVSTSASGNGGHKQCSLS